MAGAAVGGVQDFARGAGLAGFCARCLPQQPDAAQVVNLGPDLCVVGTWLSLVEHSLGVRGVGSSNLPVPTISGITHLQDVFLAMNGQARGLFLATIFALSVAVGNTTVRARFQPRLHQCAI